MAQNIESGNGTSAVGVSVGAQVVDAEGRQASVVTVEQAGDQQDALAWLSTGSGERVLVPVSLLARNDDGTYRLPWRLMPATAQQPLQMVIPVVEETLQVDKRLIDTGRGVRINKTVSEQENTVEQSLLREQLDIEHVPVGRIVAEADVPQTRYEGDTLVIPVLEEVLVVQKQLLLKEEVRITRRQHHETVPHTERVRTEHVSVEHFASPGRA